MLVSATLCHKALSLNGFLLCTKWVYKDYFSAKNGIVFLCLVHNPADRNKRYVFNIRVQLQKFKQTWSIVSSLYFKLRLL